MLLTYDGLSQNDSSKVEVRVPDSIDSLDYYPMNCMGFLLQWTEVPSIVIHNRNTELKSIPVLPKFLTIHGNALYSYDYRSYVDTPLSLYHLQQHYVQTNLKLVVANKYPFDVVFRTRQSNHPYFRNYTDVNFYFNGEEFKGMMKRKALNYVDEVYGKDELMTVKNNMIDKSQELNNLNQWLSDGSIQSKYYEYKDLLQSRISTELAFFTDSLKHPTLNPGDSLRQGLNLPDIKEYVKDYENKLLKRDRLEEEVKNASQLFEKNKRRIDNEVKEIKNKINATNSYDEMQSVARKYGIKTDSIKQRFKFLYSLQSIGAGRSFVDYSELTVKNVSLTGFHAEYKRKNYYAVAVGTVDYLFRDFFIGPRARPQYINLLRYGKIFSEGNQLIVSAYRGRKNLFLFSDSSNRYTDVYGVSLESRLSLNRDNYITAEIAKSSISNTRSGKSSFDFNDRASLALFVNLNASIKKTQTKIKASYRYQGGNFQSFTLYYTNSNFTSWSILADQYVWKKRLQIQAGLRKNEFTSVYLPIPYKSNVVFKSFQATLRIKKLPVVMVAYMPSSQLSVIDNHITENRFYTFMSSASHVYRLGKMNGVSLLMFSRYYNDPTDSGFVYYNAKNLIASQTFIAGKLTFNSSYSASIGDHNDLYTYDQGLSYNGNLFSIGFGAKYNDLNHRLTKFGYYTNGNLSIPKIKIDINASFEHGFLPGLNQTLINSDFGRLTFVKHF
jgi:DNA-binding transcriptional MerR regulator